jgi:hypothetical protein
MAENPDLNEVLQRLEVVEHKLGVYFVPNAEALLEELVTKLDPLTLQNILREVDAKVLALAMMGYQAPALKGIQAAMSKKSWGMIRDDVQYHLNLGVAEVAIRQAHLEMMSIIQKLVSLGKATLQVKDPSPVLAEWQKRNTESTGTSFKKVEGLEAWKKDVLDKI